MIRSRLYVILEGEETKQPSSVTEEKSKKIQILRKQYNEEKKALREKYSRLIKSVLKGN